MCYMFNLVCEKKKWMNMVNTLLNRINNDISPYSNIITLIILHFHYRNLNSQGNTKFSIPSILPIFKYPEIVFPIPTTVSMHLDVFIAFGKNKQQLTFVIVLYYMYNFVLLYILKLPNHLTKIVSWSKNISLHQNQLRQERVIETGQNPWW